MAVARRVRERVFCCHGDPANVSYRLEPEREARIKADYAGFRARNRQMRTAFGSELPPNMVSALAVDDAERHARFEERWAVGGFAFLGALRPPARSASQ